SVPSRKIQFAAALMHVISDHPGKRRDVAVPRPRRLVGVTWIARASEHGLNRRRRLDIASGGRGCLVDLERRSANQEHRERERAQFAYSPHHTCPSHFIT